MKLPAIRSGREFLFGKTKHIGFDLIRKLNLIYHSRIVLNVWSNLHHVQDLCIPLAGFPHELHLPARRIPPWSSATCQTPFPWPVIGSEPTHQCFVVGYVAVLCNGCLSIALSCTAVILSIIITACNNLLTAFVGFCCVRMEEKKMCYSHKRSAKHL